MFRSFWICYHDVNFTYGNHSINQDSAHGPMGIKKLLSCRRAKSWRSAKLNTILQCILVWHAIISGRVFQESYYMSCVLYHIARRYWHIPGIILSLNYFLCIFFYYSRLCLFDFFVPLENLLPHMEALYRHTRWGAASWEIRTNGCWPLFYMSRVVLPGTSGFIVVFNRSDSVW